MIGEAVAELDTRAAQADGLGRHHTGAGLVLPFNDIPLIDETA